MEPNIATAFSSNYKDYEKGATIKGYRMIFDWGESETEVLFVVRTGSNEKLNSSSE